MKIQHYSILIISAIALSLITANLSAYATTSAAQIISQKQQSLQESLCASGVSTSFSCNNINAQAQNNFGNNVAAQSGGNGDDDDDDDNDGNSAFQAISQSQSSDQDSNCVSGGSTSNSCNNFNSQTQNNYGSNVLSQR